MRAYVCNRTPDAKHTRLISFFNYLFIYFWSDVEILKRYVCWLGCWCAESIWVWKWVSPELVYHSGYEMFSLMASHTFSITAVVEAAVFVSLSSQVKRYRWIWDKYQDQRGTGVVFPCKSQPIRVARVPLKCFWSHLELLVFVLLWQS